MKSPFIFALILLSTASASTAFAQPYQWKDSSGRTIISDTPPPGAAREPRQPAVRPGYALPPEKSAVEKPAEKAANAPLSTAEKEMEFQKRQKEAKEKAEKAAQEERNASIKRDNCDRARRNIQALESQQPLSQLNERGEAVPMDNAQRYQEMERFRRVMQENCN